MAQITEIPSQKKLPFSLNADPLLTKSTTQTESQRVLVISGPKQGVRLGDRV